MEVSNLSQALKLLRGAMESYAPLEDATWSSMVRMTTLREIPRGGLLLREGDVPASFGYVCRGLLRHYTTTASGQEYNKIFFAENSFPGSMVALLTGKASTFSIEALEDSTVLTIHFARFRELLSRSSDLMWFQIQYLETNWLLAKEAREVALVQDSATERYLRFLREHPGLDARVAQYHIASHLGITPTQLSRIRGALKQGEGASPEKG